jgi:hypothetical protein
MKISGRIRSFMTVAAAAGALGAAAMAPPAGAAPGTVVATGLAQPALSDGAGTVALLLRSRVVQVLDVRSGTSRETALPQECELATSGADDDLDSAIVAVGGGKVLLGCATRDATGQAVRRPLLLDAHSGELREAPGWTAAMVEQGDPEGVRLCTPLDSTLDPDLSLLYAKPYAVTWGGDDRPLTLRHCGSTGATELQPLAPIPNDVSLAATGIVSWTETAYDGYTDAFVYLDSCRTRLHWPVRGRTALALTDAALFVSDPVGGAYRLRRIALSACMRIGPTRAATLDSGRRSAIGKPRSSVRRDRETGATATLIPPAGNPRPLAVPRAATRLRLQLGGPAKTVRWSVGGRWRSADGFGSRWTVALGPRRGARTLTVVVRGARSRERHQWRLRPLAARR